MPRFYIPANVDLPALLEANGTPEFPVEKLLAVLTAVYRGDSIGWKKPNGYVPLNSRVLEAQIGRDYVADAKRLLVELKILECDGSYSAGRESLGYRFCLPYRRKWEFIAAGEPDGKAVKPPRCVIAETPELQYLFAQLQSISFGPDAAMEARTRKLSRRRRDCWLRSIEWVEEKEFLFKADSRTGRIFTNVTSLPRDLRPFLRVNGQPLVEIDVANCQPLLLYRLYEGEPEAEGYAEAVSEGRFYEELMESCEKKWPSRDRAKKAVLRALFGRNLEPLSEMAAAFRQLYPVLWERIEEIKQDDHTVLAVDLQFKEASIILGACVRRFMERPEVPIVTVHDSILTTPEQEEWASAVLQEEFEQAVGLVPKLKVKRPDLRNAPDLRQEAPESSISIQIRPLPSPPPAIKPFEAVPDPFFAPSALVHGSQSPSLLSSWISLSP